jgi:hypothetical protein
MAKLQCYIDIYIRNAWGSDQLDILNPMYGLILWYLMKKARPAFEVQRF